MTSDGSGIRVVRVSERVDLATCRSDRGAGFFEGIETTPYTIQFDLDPK